MSKKHQKNGEPLSASPEQARKNLLDKLGIDGSLSPESNPHALVVHGFVRRKYRDKVGKR